MPPSDREFYTRTYNQLQDKYPDVDVDATSAIQIVKSEVQGLPETEGFLKLQDEFLKSTQRVIRLTKTIVQTPYMP